MWCEVPTKVVAARRRPFCRHSAADGQRTCADAVLEAVRRGTPFLGICVGMQWMFEGSEEAPRTCAAWASSAAAASASRPAQGAARGLECAGDAAAPSRLLAGVPDELFVYFTHSYRAPVVDGTVATTEYGGEFGSVVERDNIFGVQFHPEKSGEAGLRILSNFGALKC